MSTLHVTVTATGGAFDLVGLSLVAAADVWPAASRRAAAVWVLLTRAVGKVIWPFRKLATAIRSRWRRRQHRTITGETALAAAIGTAGSLHAQVIYGKPDPDWPIEQTVEWLVGRVAPMREELTIAKDELANVSEGLDRVRNELRDYASEAIARSQLEYIRARRLGLVCVAFGLMLGVWANLS